MLRFDGTQWSPMPNNAGPTEIWGVWGWSPTNLVAVGPERRDAALRRHGVDGDDEPGRRGAVRRVGQRRLTTSTPSALQGTLLHYDGTAWQLVASPTRKHLFGDLGQRA